jgi:hypothetical protein
MGNLYAQGAWDDLRFPLMGRNLDSTSGRIDYDYFNCAVGYQANARYPDEPVCMLAQMPHEWIEGSTIKPHMHWIQQSANEPNWLLCYKIVAKNTAITIETDFTNYTFLKKDSNAFTYSSGNLHQITLFPSIDMTGKSLSDCIQFALFRDSTNVSTEFAGADPSALVEYVWEFDVHYQADGLGSIQEFSKTL